MVDTDNLTPAHVDRAIEQALKKFDRWEKKVDLRNPTPTNDLYRDYQIARETAVNYAGLVGWRKSDAERLP